MKPRTHFAILPAAVGLSMLAIPAHADSVLEDLGHALTAGKLSTDLRYRFEHVDQDGVDNNANASTVRARVGYETGRVAGFGALVQGEVVQRLGPEDYNDDTTNGRTDFPTVADPNDLDLNQGYVSYTGLAGTRISAGRERIVIDDQRFIGDVGFRQNQQTFDGASVVTSAIPNLRARYHYIAGVNRIFGGDNPRGYTGSTVHAVNLNYRGIDLGDAGSLAVTGYGYFIDLDDSPASSNRTFGARLTGSVPIGEESSFSYLAEFAHQDDHGDNPNDVSEQYLIVKPSLFTSALGGDIDVTLSYERLEGDGTAAFQTPLATLHKFQGWADIFLTTPADGIEQRSIKLSYATDLPEPFNSLELQAFYFDFNAENGSADYGTEIDFEASTRLPFDPSVTLALRYADYQADDFSVDTRKVWFMLSTRF